MAALSDVRFETLRALGYSGAISDMLLAWLQTAPFGGTIAVTPKTVPDAWEAALEAANAAAPFTTGDYQRNDWWFAWLGSQGYSGNMNDRELGFWLALFQSVTGGAYSAAYSTGYS